MGVHIVMIDYHKGNLSSVARSLEDAGSTVYITDDPKEFLGGDALVLPGVGSFADAMVYIKASGQYAAIHEAVAQGMPFLGICLGQQLLFDEGDEGADEPIRGLGLLRGRVERLKCEPLKVPHVGWNQIRLTDNGRSCALFGDDMDGRNFYFTHSYVAVPENEDDVAAWTDYGTPFAAAVASRNVFGCQFHPEKSSRTGQLVLKRFVESVKG